MSFDVSADGGAGWTSLGQGTRIAGGWELSAINLPAIGQLRARGRVAGGYLIGSSGIVEQVAPFSFPAAPEIAVEQPVGTNLIDGGSAWFGGSAISVSSGLTFTIRNLGDASLTGLGMVIDGAGSIDYAAVPSTLSDLAAGESVQVTVNYSSTCPCSAALSRQVIEKSFLEAFGQHTVVEPVKVAAWLHLHATLATPHSQRSEAQIAVEVAAAAETLGLLALIDPIEQAVGTPVQTAVKRADEQAFAALNGQNLMFVEDAARRIQAALAGYSRPSVHVRHLESLHPHDAVAWALPMPEGMPEGVPA